MTITHTSRFRVRHYECDASGHVHPANYLRYAQEAAFDASDAVGWGVARYEREGLVWLARDTEIECLAPLRYGDAVEVVTWVADWRRVRSLRMYVFQNAATGDVVAHAHTDWVLLDTTTGQPRAITPEMVEAYSGGETVEAAPPRPRSAPAPAPPANAFTQRRRVEWRDIDTAQHVNNAVYLDYVADCARLAAEARGWPTPGAAAHRYHIEYRVPAVLGDELLVTTWPADTVAAAMSSHTLITRAGDDQQLAAAQTWWAADQPYTGPPTGG